MAEHDEEPVDAEVIDPETGQPEPPVKAERRKYDWPAIKARYVEGVKNGDAGVTEWPSLSEVADYFGAYISRVRERSAVEGWVEQRTKWQQHVEAVRRNAKAAAAVRNGETLDGRAVDAAKMGLQLVAARLTAIGQAAQTARSAGDTLVIDAQEQQRLAQAADLWHKIGMRAIGDPETHRVEITGANGKPLEIAAELRRDDPSRMAGVLSVLEQAGLGDLFGRGDDPDGAAAPDDAADGDHPALGARG